MRNRPKYLRNVWGWWRFSWKRGKVGKDRRMMGLLWISIILMVGYMACMKRLVMVVSQYIRRWSNLPSRLSMIRTRDLLCKNGLRRKGSSIADTIAVAEVSVVPLDLEEVLKRGAHQGAAVAKLGAAGSRRRTTIRPLHYVRPEKDFRAASPIKSGLISAPERVACTATFSCAVAKQATVNERRDETCDQNLGALVPIPHPKAFLPLTVPLLHLLQCTLDHKHPSSKDNVLDWKQSRITAQVITYYGF